MSGRTEDSTKKARLSKSRYISGLQCEKLLWWQVHEPAEDEDAPTTSRLLDRGRLVGEAARKFLPDGVTIGAPHTQFADRITKTVEAMAGNAPRIYEASFAADGVFVSVDILERQARGWALVEVKATLDVQEHHIPDVAIQLHVLERSGVNVSRVEVMHLNRECRHPDLSNLFLRENVTAEARRVAEGAPLLIRRFIRMLQGTLPKVEIGDHCNDPYPCPFMDRCHPELPRHHLSTLYRISSKALAKLIDDGIDSIHDLPEDFKAGDIARRQIDSVRGDKLIVENALAEAMENIPGPIAFLDFETINPAIPAWHGCSPYQQIPVQFSCQVQTPRGMRRHEWLADGSGDPRPEFARELIAACEGATTILAYNASFEKRRIADVWAAVPSLKPQLSKVHERIQDLLPVVRNHVYHPDFNGSFSIKSVLPALLPDMGYQDLEIQDGGTAAAVLEAVLFDDSLGEVKKDALRKQLLAYCARDTLAMVKLYERMRELSSQ